MTRLWGENGALDVSVLEYTAGEDYRLDQRLVAYDLKATAAHADTLRQAGFLSPEEAMALRRECDLLAESHARGEWGVTLEEEDCHTAIENRLTASLGAMGSAIHLGRSRNDQVLAALRLWLKDALWDLALTAEAVARSLDGIQAREGDLPMPGYTHMQPAMPSTVGLWAGAFAAELRDDAEGLRQARRRADRSPLGSAAGYGVPLLGLDRAHIKDLLGFAETHEPVTAVQLSRGKAEATALFEAALLAQDLGRLATDLCLFSMAELAFVSLPQELTTGSSIMPQKRNPDVLELARGRTGEVTAALAEVLAITAKMPSGYHRDLQLIKKPLFRGFQSVGQTAAILASTLPRLRFDAARLDAAMAPSLGLTEEAYRVVRDEGIPFREAYHRVKAGFRRD